MFWLYTIIIGAVVAYILFWRPRRSNFINENSYNTKLTYEPETKSESASRAAAGDAKGAPGIRGGRKVKIIFGTQTSTAEGFAKILFKEAIGFKFPVEIVDAEKYNPESLTDEDVIVFVVATYGEGEPTDNFRHIYDYVMDSASIPDDSLLTKQSYAVFGLGDRQYKFFCRVGVDMDAALEKLGARRIAGLGMGDAGNQLEEYFEEWKQQLWQLLSHNLRIPLPSDENPDGRPYECLYKLTYVASNASNQLDEPFPRKLSAVESTSRFPIYGIITENTELLQGATLSEGKSTRKVTLDFSHNANKVLLNYQAGDHLGVLPCNPDAVVEDYIMLLDMSTAEEQVAPADNTSYADRAFSFQDAHFKPLFPARVTVRTALKWYIDLCGRPKRTTLRAIAHCCRDTRERDEIISLLGVTPEAKAKFDDVVGKAHTIAGLIKRFPSCRPPLALFLETMPRLVPRYFSISSDSLVAPRAISLTVAKVDGGLCTGMLCNADPKKEMRIPCFVRKSKFYLPVRDKTSAVVMIGPGTGIAPLVGFLQRRQAWKKKGENLGPAMLFFGCRNEAQDYLYRSFLEECHREGPNQVLTDLELAFSRDQAKKVYVQHKIEQRAETVWDLIKNHKAYIYICGDATHMAKDVEETLISIIEANHCPGDRRAASAFLEKLTNDGRYLKDVWAS